MCRRILTFASALSLLLFILTLMLWVRSYVVRDRISYRNGSEVWGVTDARAGEIWWGHRRAMEIPIEPGWSYARWSTFTWGTSYEDFLHAEPTAISLRPWYEQRNPRSHLDVGVFARETVGSTYFNGNNKPPVIVPADATYYSAPLWLPACVFGGLAIPIVRRLIRRRTRFRDPTCCPSCSYNLTGNTSGVCPECGTAVAREAVA
jgi:hypothetical protein